MSARTRKGVTTALIAALLLVALGIAGYNIESAAAVEGPDGVGYGLPWDHELHARHPDFNCQSCHHKSRQGDNRMPACGDCHPTTPDLGQGQPEPSKASDRRHALHSSCVGCHKAVSQGPVECADCHQPGHGTKSCASCHQRTLDELTTGAHAGVSCASCHTDLVAEGNLVNDAHPQPVPRADSQGACLSCHEADEPDAAGFPRKLFSKCPARHRIDRDNRRQCLDCHDAHDPEAQEPTGRR